MDERINKLWENYCIDKDNEQLMAAYALNLCTVSVSQIVDYNDSYILDQEYDAILNNLNLERIPKESALRTILIEILNTITFFRIYDKKKEMIEKKYQQRMKEAIWDAIPSFGMIIASTNPFVIAASLALQVGSSYMNYRKKKANMANEKESALLELEFTAIEQLNALQRELFSTAWELAGKYQFDDMLRLTERQIHQYNEILLDPEPVRRYERLKEIADKFLAYPPFWYNFANTTNEMATFLEKQNESGLGDDYREEAKFYYEKFIAFKDCNLLRDDNQMSMGALELIDLCYDPTKSETLADIKNRLLPIAEKYAGNANDILQLCAIAYLKVGDYKNAVRLFKHLIYDRYNMMLNAQILNGILIKMSLQGNVNEAKKEYRFLVYGVGDESYLLSIEDCQKIPVKEVEDRYVGLFQKLLKKEYTLVIRKLLRKYTILFNKVIPTPNENIEYADWYFDDTKENEEIRRSEITKLFMTSEKEDYIYRLRDCVFPYAYLDILNRFFAAIVCVVNSDDADSLKKIMAKNIEKQSEPMATLQGKLSDPKQFSLDDYEKLNQISFTNFYDKTFKKELYECLSQKLSDKDEEHKLTISDCISAETVLKNMCEREDLPDPEYLLQNVVPDSSKKTSEWYFSKDLLGEGIGDDIDKKDIKDEMRRVIKEKLQDVSINTKRCEVIYYDNEKLRRYCARYDAINSMRLEILAVIDDLSLWNSDLVFTVDGIYPVIRGKVKDKVAYDDVYFDSSGTLMIGDDLKYTNSCVRLEKIHSACDALERIVV